MSGTAKDVTEFRRRRKAELVYIMGGGCSLCGYNKNIAALEFHHIDPSNKKYGISSKNCHNWEEDANEVRKCILLCANCHREIENSSYTELHSSFDELKYSELTEKKLYKEKNCKRCGEKLVSGAENYCKECFHFMRRTTERPTRDDFKKLLRENTMKSLGSMYGITDNSIRKWCDNFGLPRRKREIDKYTEEEWNSL